VNGLTKESGKGKSGEKEACFMNQKDSGRNLKKLGEKGEEKGGTLKNTRDYLSRGRGEGPNWKPFGLESRSKRCKVNNGRMAGTRSRETLDIGGSKKRVKG